MTLLSSVRRALSRTRRTAYEALGSDRYSRLALNDLDKKLERHLNIDGGTFIEAGANDGLRQSNTYYFEACRGWTGLLVEPDPFLAEQCRRNRRAQVVQSALVGKDVRGQMVELHLAGLMSTVSGALGDAEATRRHIEAGLQVQGLSAKPLLRVPAKTLSAVIDEAGMSGPIDLLSLDVEGGEPEALKGVDFSRHAPRFICVESRNRQAIDEILEPFYTLAEILTDLGTHQDVLYRRK